MNPLSVNFGCQIQTLDGSGREQNHIFSSSVEKSGPELRGYIAPKHKQIFFCLRSQCPQPIVGRADKDRQSDKTCENCNL